MEPIQLTNTETKFTFGGKEYTVKKANLAQVIQFQREAKTIQDSKDAGGDLLIAASAIAIILNVQDKNITKESVLQDCPGDIDVMGVLVQLGFLNQQKAELMKKVRDALVPRI